MRVNRWILLKLRSVSALLEVEAQELSGVLLNIYAPSPLLLLLLLLSSAM